MANHKSAEKRHRQSLKRNVRNSSIRSRMRTAIKKVKEAVSSGNKDEAAAMLKAAQKVIDRTSGYGVIHKKTGSRYVSNLSALVKKM